MVAEKWTGTNADKSDMERLHLEQVLRVRFSCKIDWIQSQWLMLIIPAKLWPVNNVWVCLDPTLHLGVCACVCFSIQDTIFWLLTSIRALSLSLLNGGTAGLFWNFIVACIGFVPVYCSIAELGSM
jgi:hypothetical protein